METDKIVRKAIPFEILDAEFSGYTFRRAPWFSVGSICLIDFGLGMDPKVSTLTSLDLW